MATNDLEDFVNKNAPKKPAQSDNTNKSFPKAAPHRAEDFITVYKLLNGSHLTIYFAIALAVVLFFGYKALTGPYGIDAIKAIIVLGLGAFAATDLFFFYFLFHYLAYKKFLSSTVPLTGWRELVHNRSINFWKGRTYLLMSLQIELSAKASSIHHQAVDIFLNKMLSRWGGKHSGKWKHGSPNEMKLVGKGIEGHVAIHTGTTFLICELAFHLPAFSKLLGDGLKSISFATRGERAFESEIEEDPYAEERYRKMMERD